MLLLAVVVAPAAGGCVATTAQARVASRAGALRERPLRPASTAVTGARFAVGADALTDAELAAAEATVPRRLADTLQAWGRGGVASTDALTAGRVEIARARARVVVGRDVHRHEAGCRVRVVVDVGNAGPGEVVVDAEGEVRREIPVRNVSAWELEGVRAAMAAGGGRNPLVAADAVVDSVAAACEVALRAALLDARPEDDLAVDPRDPSSPPPSSPELRRAAARARRARALQRAAASAPAAERSAALVDLADVGVLDDARVAATFLHDADPTVRRAAALAFGALCAGQTTLAPTSTACVRPAPPPSSPPPSPRATETTETTETTGTTERSSAAPRPSTDRPVAGADDAADDDDGAGHGAGPADAAALVPAPAPAPTPSPGSPSPGSPTPSPQE